MRIKTSNITIDKFIVHDIPKKLSYKSLELDDEITQNKPVLSDVPTPSSERLVRFFKSKLSSSIGSSNSVQIKYKNDIEYVPQQIEEYFKDQNLAIKSSQNIALKLFDIQNARNSEGLLLFVYGTLDNKNFIAILKVEREEGVQIDVTKDTKGNTSFNLNYIENLMLTKKTKLFKIALFLRDTNETKGYLSDNQMGLNTLGNYADFFLSDFLGCELISEPQMVTKSFFESTQEFINSSSLSPSDKASMINHLVSQLTNNYPTVNIRKFSEDSFPISSVDSGLVDEYINEIEESCQCTTFVKDTALISGKLKKQQFSFVSGVSVIVPGDLKDSDIIKYGETEDRKMKMEIIDSVKEIRLK